MFTIRRPMEIVYLTIFDCYIQTILLDNIIGSNIEYAVGQVKICSSMHCVIFYMNRELSIGLPSVQKNKLKSWKQKYTTFSCK